MWHYNDVIMDMIASQITSPTIVYSAVYSDADQSIQSKLRVTGLCVGNSPGTGEFPAQMASNAENVSIWWRHHEGKSKGPRVVGTVLMVNRMTHEIGMLPLTHSIARTFQTTGNRVVYSAAWSACVGSTQLSSPSLRANMAEVSIAVA